MIKVNEIKTHILDDFMLEIENYYNDYNFINLRDDFYNYMKEM